jgi:hypothetical protein
VVAGSFRGIDFIGFCLAGELGFEPRQAESESAVLPLDDSPSRDWLCRHVRRAAVAISLGGGRQALGREPRLTRLGGATARVQNEIRAWGCLAEWRFSQTTRPRSGEHGGRPWVK